MNCKFALLLMLTLSSCEHNVDVRGTYVPGETLNKLKVNVDTKEAVIEKIGSPYVVISANEWLYLCRREEIIPLRSNKDIFKKNFKVTFDETGKLKKIDMLDLKTCDVPMVHRETPVNRK